MMVKLHTYLVYVSIFLHTSALLPMNTARQAMSMLPMGARIAATAARGVETKAPLITPQQFVQRRVVQAVEGLVAQQVLKPFQPLANAAIKGPLTDAVTLNVLKQETPASQSLLSFIGKELAKDKNISLQQVSLQQQKPTILAEVKAKLKTDNGRNYMSEVLERYKKMPQNSLPIFENNLRNEMNSMLALVQKDVSASSPFDYWKQQRLLAGKMSAETFSIPRSIAPYGPAKNIQLAKTPQVSLVTTMKPGDLQPYAYGKMALEVPKTTMQSQVIPFVEPIESLQLFEEMSSLEPFYESSMDIMPYVPQKTAIMPMSYAQPSIQKGTGAATPTKRVLETQIPSQQKPSVGGAAKKSLGDVPYVSAGLFPQTDKQSSPLKQGQPRIDPRIVLAVGKTGDNKVSSVTPTAENMLALLPTQPSKEEVAFYDKEIKQLVPINDSDLNFLTGMLNSLGKAAAMVPGAAIAKMTIPDVAVKRAFDLGKKHGFVFAWVDKKCLPNLSFEGLSSTLLNNKGDVLALVGHVEINGFVPVALRRDSLQQFKAAGKLDGQERVMLTAKEEAKMLPAPSMSLSQETVKPEISPSVCVQPMQFTGAEQAHQQAESDTKTGLFSWVTAKLFSPQRMTVNVPQKALTVPLLSAKKTEQKPQREVSSLEPAYRSSIYEKLVKNLVVDEDLVVAWVNAGGPANSPHDDINYREEKALQLFNAYNVILQIRNKYTPEQKVYKYIDSLLEGVKKTSRTVLGYDNDLQGIERRLKALQ